MTKMRQWTIITAVAVLAVFAAGWFLMVKPQKAKAADLHTQTDSQTAANQRLNAEIATLQSEEKNLPQQQAALRKFTTQVPDTSSEPTIIRQLSSAANGSGVDLVSMTPGAPSAVAATTTAAVPATGTAATGASTVPGSTSLTTPAGGSLMQLPISIGITGTFPNVESFFQSLEKLPRAMLVTGWSLCPVGQEGAPAPSGGSGGASCSPPSIPQGKTVAPNTLGGTLSAVIFYSPPAGVASGTGVSTLPATGTTTTTSTTTTPTTTTGTPAPSTAVTPATTGATTAPAN